MVKLRNAGYCNLKLILIFFVVYGHLIENNLTGSYAAAALYRIIYFFHMPVFAFVSGLFVRDIHLCIKQLRRTMIIYVTFQLGAVVLTWGRTSLLTPYWHLWYLLSLCTWLGAAWIWMRFGKLRHRRAVVLLCVISGCAVGFAPWAGRVLSVSRTVVFLPYFMAGVMRDGETVRLKRGYVLLLLATAMILMAVCRNMPTAFLYQASPYSGEQDLFYRIVCYIVGAAGCAAALTFVPDKRYVFTKIGADTMWVYLLHAPMVLAVRAFYTEWYGCILIAAAIIIVLHLITRWYGGLYGIVCDRGSAFEGVSKNL